MIKGRSSWLQQRLSFVFRLVSLLIYLLGLISTTAYGTRKGARRRNGKSAWRCVVWKSWRSPHDDEKIGAPATARECAFSAERRRRRRVGRWWWWDVPRAREGGGAVRARGGASCWRIGALQTVMVVVGVGGLNGAAVGDDRACWARWELRRSRWWRSLRWFWRHHQAQVWRRRVLCALYAANPAPKRICHVCGRCSDCQSFSRILRDTLSGRLTHGRCSGPDIYSARALQAPSQYSGRVIR